MSDPKVMNRGLVVVGAILIQLCLGAIYAWSVFTPALTAADPADVASIYTPSRLGMDEAKFDAMKKELAAPKAAMKKAAKAAAQAGKEHGEDSAQHQAAKAAADATRKASLAAMDGIAAAYGIKDTIDGLRYGLSKTQTQAIFSAGLALFAVVMVLAGRMMPKVGPQKLALAGGLVLGVGYLLAGVTSPGNFWSTFLFVGVIGGSGIGLAYVVPIAVGMKWFPDKKGMITGLAVAGFGFGALLWVKLGGRIGSMTMLIGHVGLGTTFVVYGLAFLALCVVGGLWMKNPPPGWAPPGWAPPKAAATGSKPVAGTVDFTSGQMLAMPQFYMIFFCFMVGAGAGLMSIGLMKLFPGQALEAAGKSAAEASAIAGTAMAVFYSLANGIGRIAWGMLSDKIGRKTSICVMLATQGVFVILFQWMADTPATLYLFAALIGFNFGGNFALFPTITADTFGAKYIGQNYAWVFLSYGVGGIFGPMLGGALGDVGNFPLAFTICGVLVLVAAGVIAMVRHPHHVPAAVAEAGETPLEIEAEGEVDGAAREPDEQK